MILTLSIKFSDIFCNVHLSFYTFYNNPSFYTHLFHMYDIQMQVSLSRFFEYQVIASSLFRIIPNKDILYFVIKLKNNKKKLN